VNGGPITEADAGRERPVDAVRGTRDWLPDECARMAALEALLLDRFARAGYEPLRTPVLEPTELHERRSGAGIVSKLFELAGAGPEGVCLRPELTAGIVRAYTEMSPAPGLPWRVSHAGPVFRYETPRPDRLREFQQVGVERLGDGGAAADAEVIWLAVWALAEAGVARVSVRLGHVGLILEMLRRSGLPAPLGSALIERLSEAAAEGQGVHALETALDQLSGWLRSGAGEAAGGEVPGPVEGPGGEGIDRLFRTLVPVVTGRRTGREIVHRLRRKWDLGHGLLGALEQVRGQVHDLAGLKGPPGPVLDRLGPEGEALAPDSVASLRSLIRALEGFGIDPSRLELDLGFGRGIGFYSQVVFEITAEAPDGSAVEVGGGGRYDGLARVLGSDRDDRGVGFAFGLERLAAVLDAQGQKASERPPRGLLVVVNDPAHAPAAAEVATLFRVGIGMPTHLETGLAVEEALDRARVLGVPRVIVVSGPMHAPGSLTLYNPQGDPPVTVEPESLTQLVRTDADTSPKRRRP
jgi:histidyl-tRNA synthetase